MRCYKTLKMAGRLVLLLFACFGMYTSYTYYAAPWWIAQTLEPVAPPPPLTEWHRPTDVAGISEVNFPQDIATVVYAGLVKMPSRTQLEYIVVPRSEIRRHQLTMYMYSKGKQAPYQFVIRGIEVIDDDSAYNQVAMSLPANTRGD